MTLARTAALLTGLLGLAPAIQAADVTLETGASQDFTAVVYDQFGNPMASQPTVNWAATGGTVDPATGAMTTYLAGSNTGDYQIDASSGALSASRSIAITLPAAAVPVALLKMDDGSGSTATDSSGNGEDHSANLQGDAQFADPGVSGGAVVLDGDGDYLTMSASGDLNSPAATTQRTISLWFRLSDPSDPNRQMLFEEGGGTRGLNLYVEDGLLYGGGWNTPSEESGWSGTWLTAAVDDQQWHHAALVLDAGSTVTADSLHLYLDGNPVASGDGSQLWPHTDDNGIGAVIGSSNAHDGVIDSTGAFPLAGAMDELAIYVDVLTDSEIAALADLTPPTVNDPPSVAAGSNDSITLPTDSYALDGTVSDPDGDPLTTTWTKVSGPGTVAFNDANAVDTTATFGSAGTYVLRLTADDGTDTASDDVQIVVNAAPNGAPTADAGSNDSITLPTDSYALDGTVSDPDGDPLTTTWSKVSGPGTVAFNDANAVDTTATFGSAGTYVLRLTADDGTDTASDDVQIAVNDMGTPLSVDAGPDQQLTLPYNTVNLPATADGADGTVTWSWTQLSGPASGQLSQIDSAEAQLFVEEAGVYELEVAADDGVEIRSDQVTVFVNPFPPDLAGRHEAEDANLGNGLGYLDFSEGNEGSAYRDDDLDVQATGDVGGGYNVGWIEAGERLDWSVLSQAGFYNVTVRVATANSSDKSFRLLLNDRDVSGLVTFNTGGAGWQTYQDVVIENVESYGNFETVRLIAESDSFNINWIEFTYLGEGGNDPPSVAAGSDDSITLPTDSYALDGTVSDPDNDPLTTTWTTVSGPGTVAFDDANAVDTTATFGSAGTYVLRLTADDGTDTASDDVQIVVNEAPNGAPTADAGSDDSITLPTDSYALDGTVSDPDNDPLTTTWATVSGPGTVSFNDANAVDTTVTFGSAGTYILRLTADDGTDSASDDIQIVVNPEPGGTGAYLESGGQVVMEAENYDSQTQDSNWAWVARTDIADSSGGTTLEADPNTNKNFSDTTNGPQLDFEVDFSTTGTYYVWVRMWGSSGVNDSLHAGLDGNIATTGKNGMTDNSNQWAWVDQVNGRSGTDTVTVEVTSAGVHTVNVWMREDGTRFDKILLTTDSGYSPSGQGPAESARDSGGGGNQAPIVDAGADDAITLPTDTATLNGAASDPDSDPLTISWAQISGPSGATIQSPSAAVTDVVFTADGTYVFELTADDGTDSSSDQVTVEVSPEPTTGFSVKVNFQDANSVTPTNYLPDTGLVYADQGNGHSYGWDADTTGAARDRNSSNSPDQRWDTFNHFQKGSPLTWEIAVPNDTYDIHVVFGDPSYTNQVNHMDIEGVFIEDPDGQDHFDEHDVQVTVSDGRLTITTGPNASNAKIAFIDITAAPNGNG